jgi:hypothetical protein
MSSDLEARRRAIADALRAVMAEPMPEPAEQPTVEMRPELFLVPARGEPDDWLVPPMETVGSMSRTASLALFGHA